MTLNHCSNKERSPQNAPCSQQPIPETCSNQNNRKEKSKKRLLQIYKPSSIEQKGPRKRFCLCKYTPFLSFSRLAQRSGGANQESIEPF
ncbi:hypothetical protein TNCT_261751 [Trichonephila clavata]|uniref:Uncharacterized protein n=1 Tax=Trichonephila clavata TaxID=2740835 RepID=A0A8X6M2R9_TRICU|nr:hypothetical protein TNCT_261751 [Trichonephila clavata]